MKIQWNFADGTTSEVEVDEEFGAFITASRREEDNLSRKTLSRYRWRPVALTGKDTGTTTLRNGMETTERNKASMSMKNADGRYSSVCLC